MTDQTSLEKPMSYEGKLKERIRESVGELMTDEDLKNLIDAGIKEWLFEPRRQSRPYGGYDEKPPLIIEMIQETFQPMMARVVKEWVTDNQELLLEKFDELYKEGAGNAMIQALASLMHSPMDNLRYQLQQQFNFDPTQ